MKPSAGFNPRRLRSPIPGRWRRGFCSLLAILLIGLGLALLASAFAGLSGQTTSLATTPAQTALGVFISCLLLWLGIFLWRRCRKQRQSGGLDIAPHLLKRR